MTVLIEIGEGLYQEIIDNAMFAPKIIPDVKWAITSAIVNGIPLNGTNGDVLKAVFENVKTTQKYKGWADVEINPNHFRVSEDWWNAPYKGESEE